MRTTNVAVYQFSGSNPRLVPFNSDLSQRLVDHQDEENQTLSVNPLPVFRLVCVYVCAFFL